MKALPDWKKVMWSKFWLGIAITVLCGLAIPYLWTEVLFKDSGLLMLFVSALLAFLIGGVTGLYWPMPRVKDWTQQVFYQAILGILFWLVGLLILIVLHL